MNEPLTIMVVEMMYIFIGNTAGEIAKESTGNYKLYWLWFYAWPVMLLIRAIRALIKWRKVK